MRKRSLTVVHGLPLQINIHLNELDIRWV